MAQVTAKKKTSKAGAKTKSGKTLVIVESPSKARSIGKYLGSNYKVIASVGHVRDLPKSKLGIDKEANFEPAYINIRGKGDVIKELKKEAAKAKHIYLATDPDREGEAIAWHIAYILGLDESSAARISFNEINKAAVKKAIAEPRLIDRQVVDAQQARRVLDRLVGYEISPLLWRKIHRGLSAGRVQSAALKIVVDREREIRAFVPEEFWNIALTLKKQSGEQKEFTAKLLEKAGEKITVHNKDEADEILAAIKNSPVSVARADNKQRKRKAFAPFTTSSLQQEASNKLGFTTKKTMAVAQQLYEGVDVKGHGTTGLVTYIRTDSVRISDEADAAVKAFIVDKYSKEYLGNNTYSNKKKDVQDAHEAIRPSYVELIPDEIKDSLSSDQFKLYNLIWSRFVSSRMSVAVYDAISADIVSGDYMFRASGSKLHFDGFLKVYKTSFSDDEDKMLPELVVGEALDTLDTQADQSFTQAPARFTEASLVKELEEKDIGRPSTYVPIIATLTDRKYVKRDKKTLIPTDLGFTVTELMEQYFKEVVDSGFTASMEDRLDDIEISGTDWHKIISDFYAILEKELEIADNEIEKVEIEDEATDEICELCGKPMVIKHGRFGRFIACSGYPECKNTKQIVVKTGVMCPLCGKEIVQRRSKRGRYFYGCSGYPDCTQVYWNKPTNKKCPKCGAPMCEKNTKKDNLQCSNKDCGYAETVEIEGQEQES